MMVWRRHTEPPRCLVGAAAQKASARSRASCPSEAFDGNPRIASRPGIEVGDGVLAAICPKTYGTSTIE